MLGITLSDRKRNIWIRGEIHIKDNGGAVADLNGVMLAALRDTTKNGGQI